MKGSIPGPRDHDLRQRQTPNPLSHPGTLILFIINKELENEINYSAYDSIKKNQIPKNKYNKRCARFSH